MDVMTITNNKRKVGGSEGSNGNDVLPEDRCP